MDTIENAENTLEGAEMEGAPEIAEDMTGGAPDDSAPEIAEDSAPEMVAEKDFLGTATYSPEDNKLRFYPFARLSKEDYAIARARGFIWAPQQKLFVAPTWSPSREDLMLRWCGEIGDEDTSLVDRAEARAERFEEYSGARKQEADRAHETIKGIMDGIPLGQPILVGHHSERRARKDAERIDNGMRRAVNLWKTSEYWKDRAEGALRHAKYKERPEVRARRIKTLESELRKCIAAYTPCVTKDRPNPMYCMQQKWSELYPLDGRKVDRDAIPEKQHVWVGPHGRGGHWTAVEDLEPIKRRMRRWEEHYMHRLEYEHAMLEEQGATSLLDKKPRSASAQLPLCNYRAPEGLQIPNNYRRGELLHYPQVVMSKAQYAKIYTDYKGTRVVNNSHRVRTAVVSRREFQLESKPEWGPTAHVCVFLTDSKVHDAPGAVEPKAPPMPSIEEIQAKTAKLQEAREKREAKQEEARPFRELEEALRKGTAVKVVSVPQLFPTPVEIAEKLIAKAEIAPGMTVLEPSAGTGVLVREIIRTVDTEIVGYEINLDLVIQLSSTFPSYKLQARCKDFLSVTDGQGCFPRIVMNPPFKNGDDIKHIQHAMTFLCPGGRLVALCANGPRQQEAFKVGANYGAQYEVVEYTPLPAGSFEEQGTGVNVAMIVIEKAGKCAWDLNQASNEMDSDEEVWTL